MAGRGPAPKPKEQRRNRHVPSRGEWVDLPAVTVPVLPELPKRKRGSGPWHPRTVAVWAAWRQDPASTQYGPAEIAAAIELAWLFEDNVRGERSAPASEVRQRMQALGLDAKGKRDLRWRTVAETETIAAQPKLAEVRRLRAVDSAS
jgi:hypothetical protein